MILEPSVRLSFDHQLLKKIYFEYNIEKLKFVELSVSTYRV